MKSNEECLIDSNGIELNVSYEYERSDSQIENGGYEAGLRVETEIKTVEIVILKKGIDITNLLSQKQKDWIIEQLTYE